MPEAAPVTSATLFSRQVHSEFLPHRQDADSLAVLFVADVLHPIYGLTLNRYGPVWPRESLFDVNLDFLAATNEILA
jgi:hypothetical protein